ncbi:hypothetical protein BDZ89DRAFT_1083126 [Hymenopellis radicata]|nr:hypothetical protein BDZ89DRAFT_1083126 [Hymenopellis radicata]
MLRRLVIGHPECPTTDVNDGEWKKAALVTPRHGVRRAWNDAALRKQCQETGQRLYVCRATDAINGRDLTLAEEYGLALRNSQRTATGRNRRSRMTWKRPSFGARGTIVDIILDPDEP